VKAAAIGADAALLNHSASGTCDMPLLLLLLLLLAAVSQTASLASAPIEATR
jgi:hypothetical protein